MKVLTVTVNVSSTRWVAKHIVNNALVKQLIGLRVNWVIKTDAIKSANGNIISCKQQFLQNYILQNSHNGFLVDVEFALIDNNQDTEPTKREHYWMRTLKTLYFDGLNL